MFKKYILITLLGSISLNAYSDENQDRKLAKEICVEAGFIPKSNWYSFGPSDELTAILRLVQDNEQLKDIEAVSAICRVGLKNVSRHNNAHGHPVLAAVPSLEDVLNGKNYAHKLEELRIQRTKEELNEEKVLLEASEYGVEL